jgi:uncharacterized protein (TIGR03089 family)
VATEQRISSLVHDLLVHRVSAAGARPLLVHRDEAAGTRVELSAVSLTNTVAKASALLDQAGPDATVVLELPSHWLGAALALAAWHGGHCLWVAQPGIEGPPADVAVVGPSPSGQQTKSEVTYVSRLHPFGLPFDDELPWDVTDLALALREGPDLLGPPPPTPARSADDAVRENATLAAARTYTAALRPGATLVSALPLHELRGLLAVTLVPLLTGGSAVLVTGSEEPDDLAAVAATERADAVWTRR